ncbi:unnamed protein product, partial [marine sediment metagenome]
MAEKLIEASEAERDDKGLEPTTAEGKLGAQFRPPVELTHVPKDGKRILFEYSALLIKSPEGRLSPRVSGSNSSRQQSCTPW